MMFNPRGNPVAAEYNGLVTETHSAQETSTFASSLKKKETPTAPSWLPILSAVFRSKKTASSHQEETTDIDSSFTAASKNKKKPTPLSSFSSKSTNSTDTNITPSDSFYTADGCTQETDDVNAGYLFIGKETDSSFFKKRALRQLDEQTIQKKYSALYQEFHRAGTSPQRLCSFLAKFDATNPVVEKNEDISSSIITFFTQQTLKNLGIDHSKNPTLFEFVTQTREILTDPRKKKSALVLGQLQTKALDLLEHPPANEPPAKRAAMAFLKFVSETGTLDL